jgi:VWFA-related protein
MRPIKPILLALTLTLPATAQTPTLKVYSRETIVDVTVTDAKGNPVHGLKQEDFTLKEDNKPQPIRSFHEYATQPIPAPPKLPPNVYTNLQPPPPSSAVNIFFLDFTNAAPVVPFDYHTPRIGGPDLGRAMGDQRREKQDATKYLQTMPPGTRVAVLGASSPGSLRVVQGITSDRALLSAAIDTMQYDTVGNATTYETWCTQQDMRNRMTLESLNQIAADLAGIKGRKNLLWFTIGIPTMTDPAWRPPCLPDYARDLNKAFGLLTAAQVTVFPIGARGVPLGVPSVAGQPMPPSRVENLSMESIAEATGGIAYYNSNDLEPAVAKAIATGSDYYTLSYVPPGTEYDGRHHTINLKTTQPGLHLTYRTSYYAEDPTKMTPPVGLTLTTAAPVAKAGNMQAAMSRSMPTSTDLLFDVQVEPSTEPPKPTDPPVFGILDPKLAALSSKNGKHLTRYGFEYVLPARQIAFTPTPEGNQKAALEFDIAVYDAEDKLITSLSQSIQPTLTPAQHDQLLKGPFRFFQQLDLPPGPLFLRIGILDATSNKAGTLEIPLTVPKK